MGVVEKLKGFFNGTGREAAPAVSRSPVNQKLIEWRREADEETALTRDVAALEQCAYQPVFVCDEMMSGLPKHNLLGKDAIFIGKAFTDQTSFTLWKKKLGKEAEGIPIRSIGNNKCARIRGELYAVPSQRLFLLDKHKRNGLHFKRRRIEINLPYRSWRLVEDTTGTRSIRVSDEHNYELRAWMYLGVPTYWNEHLDGGYLYGLAEKFFPKHNYAEAYYSMTIKDFQINRIEPKERELIEQQDSSKPPSVPSVPIK